MAEKPVARVGDPGSHGGVITSGASTIFVNGRPIARVGDLYACPKHGPNPIVTGAPHVFGQGQLVAHVGSKTACGAEIIIGSPDTFVDTSNSKGEALDWDHNLKSYDQQFRIIDEITGEPIEGVNYKIITQSGFSIEGITGKAGLTERIFTGSKEEKVTLYYS